MQVEYFAQGYNGRATPGIDTRSGSVWVALDWGTSPRSIYTSSRL
uniref:Uncharacterized protein n=1 Tax=Anguilla anguilla TaxID=7936 RepID=A0A0E9W554_ANGAN